MIGAGSVWFGGKAFGGEEKAKRVYKYHRYVASPHCPSALPNWSSWPEMSGNYPLYRECLRETNLLKENADYPDTS